MYKKIFFTMPLLLALLIIAGQSVASGNNYYRWMDERGNPVHSDRPPPQGTDYEVISSGSSLKRVVTADQGAVPAEVTPRVGNQFKQVDTQAEKEAHEKNPELCSLAKSNLSTLNSAARVRLRDDNGDLVFLTPEQKSAQVSKAEQMIEVHCP